MNTSKDFTTPKDHIDQLEWWLPTKRKKCTGDKSNQLSSKLFLYKTCPLTWLQCKFIVIPLLFLLLQSPFLKIKSAFFEKNSTFFNGIPVYLLNFLFLFFTRTRYFTYVKLWKFNRIIPNNPLFCDSFDITITFQKDRS